MQADALAQGKHTARQSYEEQIANSVVVGACAAHKIVSRDAGLPPLRMVFKDKTKDHITYVTEPIQVAARHTEPWTTQWRAYDRNFERDVIGFFKAYRLTLAEPRSETDPANPKTTRDKTSPVKLMCLN